MFAFVYVVYTYIYSPLNSLFKIPIEHKKWPHLFLAQSMYGQQNSSSMQSFNNDFMLTVWGEFWDVHDSLAVTLLSVAMSHP